MTRKYFATRHMVINGKTFNAGDIVWSDRDILGLVRCEQPKPIDQKKSFSKNSFAGNQNPVISVIVTFHNQLKFVDECLGGFLRQSIKIPYEIIAVVDASIENEFEHIKKQYPEVRVFQVDFANADPARNFGQDQARGEYIAHFDGDDYPYGEYLEKMMNGLEDGKYDFVYSRFDHDLFRIEKGKLPRCNVFEWSESWGRYSPITNTPILIKKNQCPRWDTKLQVMQDTAFGLSLINAGLKGKHIRQKLWFYRHHLDGSWNDNKYTKKRAEDMQILRDEFGLVDKKADLTFISLLCRDEVLEEYFGQIPKLGMPKATHWFVMVDSDDENFIDKIKSYQKKYEKYFLSTRMFVTGETNAAKSRDFEERGMRIANFIKIIINQAAERIGGTEYLFMVEDDTIAPKNAYKTLKPLMKNKEVIYASGIEPGRGYSRHTGICWLNTDEKGEVIERIIPEMREEGVVEIQGGGWYCWIGRTRELKDFIDYNPMRCIDGKMLGPDVMMVYDIARTGKKALCDYSVQCKHFDPSIGRFLEAMEGQGYNITYYKNNQDKWRMKMTRPDGTFYEMTT